MFNKFVASITFICFSFFAALPAQARQKATERLIFNKVALYNNALKEYQAKGAQAFIEKFGVNLPAQDRKDFLKLLKGTPELPTAEVKNDKLVMTSGSTVTVVEITDAANRAFRINGKSYVYDMSIGLEGNVKAMERLLNSKSFSLMDWLIPQALALDAIWIALIAVAALLLGLFLGKNSDDKKTAGNGRHGRDHDGDHDHGNSDDESRPDWQKYSVTTVEGPTV